MLGLNTYKIEELASLPYPVEGGQLYEYKEWVYYIGGNCTGSSNGSLENEPAEFMRFNYQENYWEIIFNDSLVLTYRKRIDRNILFNKSFDEIDQNLVSFNKLMDPGTVLIGSFLYVLGGKVVEWDYFTSDTIFTIDLDILVIKKLDVTLPKPLAKLTCINYKKNILVFGGFDEDNQQDSAFFTVFAQNEDLEIPNFSEDFYCNNKPWNFKENIFIILKQKIMILKKDSTHWETLELGSNKFDENIEFSHSKKPAKPFKKREEPDFFFIFGKPERKSEEKTNFELNGLENKWKNDIPKFQIKNIPGPVISIPSKINFEVPDSKKFLSANKNIEISPESENLYNQETDKLNSESTDMIKSKLNPTGQKISLGNKSETSEKKSIYEGIFIPKPAENKEILYENPFNIKILNPVIPRAKPEPINDFVSSESDSSSKELEGNGLSINENKEGLLSNSENFVEKSSLEIKKGFVLDTDPSFGNPQKYEKV